MAERCLATLPFGFQDPRADDFGRLAHAIVERADRAVHDRRHLARLMLVPSLLLYQLFAFGVGAVLWSMGVELRPLPLAAATCLSFLVMAGLGVHYREEADWSAVAEGAGRLHRRILGQAMVVRWLSAAFFYLPLFVMRQLAGLFPRRPRVDPEILSFAAHLAAALDEAVPVSGLTEVVSGTVDPAVVQEAVLLLAWSGGVSLLRRGAVTRVKPGPEHRRLLAEMRGGEPVVVQLSTLTRAV